MKSHSISEPVQLSCLRSSFFSAPLRLILVPLLLGMCLSVSAMAQSANITVGSASGSPGSTVVVPVSFTPGATGVSTLQFDLMFSSSLSYSAVSAGAAATNAGKSASANAISGGARVLIFGLNQNAIGSGILANVQLTVSPSAPAGSLPVAISGIVASDANANQVQASGMSGIVTVAGQPTADTTPPVISGVSSSHLSGTGATITWTTNEPSDSQVEYGTTTGYGSTALNSSMVTSHSQALSGLSKSTLYHYRVKSRDAAGNLATSGDYTFTTTAGGTDTTPPVISDVWSSSISATGATITWVTNESSDSQVEYGTSPSYGSITSLDSAMVTLHSKILTGLTANTLYHYRVKSGDADGNVATSGDYTFTTTESSLLTLVFPHFSSGPNGLGTDTMSGMGVVNLNSSSTTVTFTAVEEDGNLTAGQDIVNPKTLNLNGREQLPIVDSQLFGSGFLNSNSNGYVKVESANKDTSGFFLVFDGDLSFQDGANLSDTPLTDFVFTGIQADGYNKISIINTNSENADLTIDLVGADGIVRSSISKVIDGNGSLTADLFSDLFVGVEPHAADYVRVESSEGVQSFQVMRQKSGDIAMLAGQDVTAGGTTLYSPLYVFGQNYRTNLSVINLDSIPGTVSLRLIGQNGVQLGASRQVAIPANGKLYIDDSGFFTALDPNVLNGGYVEIVSDGVRLSGSIVLGDINGRSFYAALALISSLQNSVLFSHVASDDVYFTGICILNPGTQPATVRLELYDADGMLREIQYRSIGAKQQQSLLLSQYFTSLNGQNQTSGYVRLSSTVPIASYAAFGTRNLSIISAIPPQIVH
jgi:hypothetical protein